MNKTLRFATRKTAEFVLPKAKREAIALERNAALQTAFTELAARLKQLRPDDFVLQEWTARHCLRLRLEVMDHAEDSAPADNVTAFPKRRTKPRKPKR